MALSDATITVGLRTFAAAAGPILDRLADAGGHLTEDGAPRSGMVALARNRLAEIQFPGSPTWPTMTAEDRAAWWTARIWVVLGSPAAAPELLGAGSDHFPIGAAVEAAARGLAVCATAREYGVIAPSEQVGLLARVLLRRGVAPEKDGAGMWALPERPRHLREAVAESVQLGRDLMSLLDDVADELHGLVSTSRRTGWGRVPGIAAVRAAKDLRATLRTDSRITATLLVEAAASSVGHDHQLDRNERSS